MFKATQGEVETVKETKPAPKSRKRKSEAAQAPKNDAEALIVSTYVSPNHGPYTLESKKGNQTRFSKAQGKR